jgi:UDP-N-acetylglucosamine 2-epimerase
MKIAFIIGTRPELIKVAPVIWEAQKRNLDFDVVNSAQHKDLLEPYWTTFNIKATHVLDVMREGQNLASLASRAIQQIQNYIDTTKIPPTIILAQGDTTTVMAAGIVSFYNCIHFAHLEAGLRSFDFENPFPEEYNRRIAAIGASFHFCPTKISKKNLIREGVSENKIYVVGNTIVDALNIISQHHEFLNSNWNNDKLDKLNYFDKTVLITCHRRENHGNNLIQIIEAIVELSKKNPKIGFIWTLHPNPKVRESVLESELKVIGNVLLIDPLEYPDLLKVIQKSFCVISDSGGIQEEAPSFQTPVIVLRKKTERPEGVDAGIAFLVGADKELIVAKFEELKNKSINFSTNPYGDGFTSVRLIDILLENLI